MSINNDLNHIEHIRTHASMYIGRLGDGTHFSDGVYTLLQEVLNLFVNEFRAGYGKKLVVYMTNERTIYIRDYGRGLSIEERVANSSLRVKTADVTQFGIDTVIALSDYFDVNVYKERVVELYRYYDGEFNYKDTYKEKQKEGLSISFKIDERIFGKSKFKHEIVCAMLQNIVYQNVGLEIDFDRIRLKSKKGMAELLSDRKRCRGYYLYPIVHFKDEWIEVAFTHSWASGETYYSFVNGVNTHQGGVHLSVFRKTLALLLINYYSFEGFIPEDVYSGLMVAITVNVECPVFGDNNRWKLYAAYLDKEETLSLEEYLKKFFLEKFIAYLSEHLDVCNIIHAKMSLARDRREYMNKCMKMSIDELVVQWNDGKDSGLLDSEDFHAIRDALSAKGVQTIDMQKTGAIHQIVKISYNAKENAIRCGTPQI